MLKRIAPIVGIALIALVLFTFNQPVIESNQELDNTSLTSEVSPQLEPTGEVESESDVQTYTMADISEHDSVESCWVAVNDKVYDLTEWIQQHPGGPARILAICGTDATEEFGAKHGENEKAQSALSAFVIGELVL